MNTHQHSVRFHIFLLFFSLILAPTFKASAIEPSGTYRLYKSANGRFYPTALTSCAGDLTFSHPVESVWFNGDSALD